MKTGRANRALAPPPGAASMACPIQEPHVTRGDPTGSPREELSLEQSMLRRLRPMALRRLEQVMQHEGELPWDGSSGVLLPPLSERFLGDELGCRPALAGRLLAELTAEGILAYEGSRFRVPDPTALRAGRMATSKTN